MIKEKYDKGKYDEEVISYVNKRYKKLLTGKALEEDVLSFIKVGGTAQLKIETRYPTQRKEVWQIINNFIKKGSVSHIGNVFYRIKRAQANNKKQEE